MGADARLRLGLVVVLLAAGLVVASLRPAPVETPASAPIVSLWLSRRADLVLQLGLMLVGALGIRALLPGEDEEENTPP